MFLFCFALACTNEPAPSPTADFSDLWKGNRAGALDIIRAKSDQEKIVIVRNLIKDPSVPKDPSLCSVLPSGDQDHCRKLLHRSHIWEYDIIRQNQQQHTPPKSYSGPSSSEIIPPSIVNATVLAAIPATQCAQQSDQHWCIQRSAAEQATAGSATAGGLCQSLAEGQSREECFFQIAEASLPNLSVASDYCQRSQTYSGHCYAHLIEQSVPVHSLAWSDFTSVARRISEEFTEDQSFQQQVVAYYWALTVQHLFETGKTRLLPSEVPPDVARHVRAAKAYAYLGSTPAVKRSLAEWRSMIEEVNINTIRGRTRPVRDLWPYNRTPQEQAFQATFYLALARRPYVDTEQDWDIVTALALVQHRFPTQHLESDDPIVQWVLKSSR